MAKNANTPLKAIKCGTKIVVPQPHDDFLQVNKALVETFPFHIK